VERRLALVVRGERGRSVEVEDALPPRELLADAHERAGRECRDDDRGRTVTVAPEARRGQNGEHDDHDEGGHLRPLEQRVLVDEEPVQVVAPGRERDEHAAEQRDGQTPTHRLTIRAAGADYSPGSQLSR
jgi:hypothetical protein